MRATRAVALRGNEAKVVGIIVLWAKNELYTFRSTMRAHTEYLTFHTKKRRELIHLTPTLEAILERSGIQEGFMLVSAMHITAGVFVNDDESGLHRDIWK